MCLQSSFSTIRTPFMFSLAASSHSGQHQISLESLSTRSSESFTLSLGNRITLLGNARANFPRCLQHNFQGWWMLWSQPRTTGNSFFQLALSFEKSYLFTSFVLKWKWLKRALYVMMHQPTFQIFTYPWDTTIAPNSNTHSSLNKQTNNALILTKKLFANV